MVYNDRSVPPSRVETILAWLRAAPTAGYSERHELFQKAARAVRSLCPTLKRRDAESARPLFFAVLEMPLSGTCAPQCCDASYVRSIQIAAKCEVLTTWRRIDPEIVRDIPPALMQTLVIPTSNRIALVMVELVACTPEALPTHIETLIRALEHPRWQVAECAARSLGKMGPTIKKQTLKSLVEALRHSQWQVRKAAARAVGRVAGNEHERLERLAQRDNHPAVRHAAKKALGISTRDLAKRQ